MWEENGGQVVRCRILPGGMLKDFVGIWGCVKASHCMACGFHVWVWFAEWVFLWIDEILISQLSGVEARACHFPVGVGVLVVCAVVSLWGAMRLWLVVLIRCQSECLSLSNEVLVIVIYTMFCGLCKGHSLQVVSICMAHKWWEGCQKRKCSCLQHIAS